MSKFSQNTGIFYFFTYLNCISYHYNFSYFLLLMIFLNQNIYALKPSQSWSCFDIYRAVALKTICSFQKLEAEPGIKVSSLYRITILIIVYLMINIVIILKRLLSKKHFVSNNTDTPNAEPCCFIFFAVQPNFVLGRQI